ncbi:MAG: Hsp70 family protein [Deltaproteobacteria bacterium]|nr:Hsp70 family protein [Deltaproteobacteria bacterium]
MSVRCGIDLGTTYSALSWYDPDNRRVETVDLDTADGGRILRSVVFYEPGGQVVVGEAAYNAARKHPDRVLIGVKRSMGDNWKTPSIDGHQYTPQEISAEILKVLKTDAENFLGEPIHDVVITVPAYFGDNQRAATEEAGRLAGLNVLALMPEPHAAALAFSIDRVHEVADRALLVYDLGGGTFDVTLIRTTTETAADGTIGLKVTTLCKEGNRHLGGLDWDRNLSEIVAQRIQNQHGVDPQQDAADNAALQDNCEKAKRQLTQVTSYSVVGDIQGHTADVTRAELEQVTADLLLQTEALLLHVLEMAEQQYGLTRDQIDVLLSGGSSKMPMVEQMISRVMGKASLRHKNPELLVTQGAAYMAYLLGVMPSQMSTSPEPQPDPNPTPSPSDSQHTPPPPPDPVIVVKGQRIVLSADGLVDTGKAVGVEIIGGFDAAGNPLPRNAVIVPDGAVYGQEYEKDFATSRDNMTEIPVVLYEGADADLANCTHLASVTISGLPPGRPKGKRVRVKLSYDPSGIIRGEGVDLESGQKVDILIDRRKS